MYILLCKVYLKSVKHGVASAMHGRPTVTFPPAVRHPLVNKNHIRLLGIRDAKVCTTCPEYAAAPRLGVDSAITTPTFNLLFYYAAPQGPLYTRDSWPRG